MRRLVVERHDDRKAGPRHIDPLLPNPEPPRDPGTTANIQATQPPKVPPSTARSEKHTSELQSLMSTSYAAFCLKQKISRYKPNLRRITTEHTPDNSTTI